jgi:predicted GH43/DUF377 family glycosyl hydrolase
MEAKDILNNTDPKELRNLLKKLKLNADAFQRPVPNIIINQAPQQYPSTPSTTTIITGDGFDFRRYLAVYNYILWDDELGDSPTGYHLGLATSHNSRDWVIRDEPVIPLGSSGAWDDYNHQFPCLLQVDGVLYLYFTGKTDFTWANFKIGVARSFDGGLTWEKYASNPIINNNIAWENTNVFSPVVLYDREESNSSKRWKMWYGGSSFGEGIGYAYSADGLSWTKFASNPVVSLGTSGQWDDTYIYPAAVIRRGNEFILFYGGHDGSVWSTGYVTFTDPEGTYTRSANNPLITGDGVTSTLTADLAAGSTTAAVSDATVFPIGCPVWIGVAPQRFLTRVTKRNSSTSLELENAAPNTVSSGEIVRSVAYASVNITDVQYDDGYKFNITPHKPDGLTEVGVHELSMLGYANDDLTEAYIDYGAGIIIPVSVAESQNENITRENLTILDTWEQEANRHKPAGVPGDMLKATYDADNDGVVDNSEQLQGHPASDFVLESDLFNDGEGNPADVTTGSAADGTSAYPARRDHVHHYDQPASQSSAGQVTTITRWSSGGGTTFELLDVAEDLTGVFDNGSLVDPFTYSLSSDRTQLVFDSSITAGHIVVAQSIIAQV